MARRLSGAWEVEATLRAETAVHVGGLEGQLVARAEAGRLALEDVHHLGPTLRSI